MMQNNMVRFTEQSFVQNVFGSRRSYSQARDYVEQALQVQVDFVDDAVSLTPQQRSKLELAGQGDIQRFFNDYEEVKRGMTFGNIPRDEWQAVWQKAQPLSTRFAAGLHGRRSLLKKTLTSTLGPEQLEQFTAVKAERDRLIYQDNIRMTLSMVDRKVPLTKQQRDQITQLLLAKSSPPEFYGQSSMRFYAVLIELAKMPQDELRELFSETEWRVIDGLMRQARAMERTLQMQREALER